MKSGTPKTISWMAIFGMVALCVVSRLPQILNPYFHPDYNGDECVLGLMAKHMAEGRDFSFCFWGQNYGFCWIEAGAVALGFKLAGISIYTLKVPMLLLWTLGCVFFYGALAAWTSRMYGFWITCLLVLSPAWMGWCLRARAGYVTAFLLTTIVLFLIARGGDALKKLEFLWVGALMGFIYFSQPIYLVGLFPLLATAFLKQKGWKNVFLCSVGFFGILAFGKFMIYVQGNNSLWHPPWFRRESFHVFWSSLPNNFFNAINQDSWKFWAAVLVSKAWGWLLVVDGAVFFWGLMARKISALSAPFLSGALMMLGCTFFINCEGQWRYLLGVSVFLILWFGIQSFEWIGQNNFLKVFHGVAIAGFILLGVVVAWNFGSTYRLTSPVTVGMPEMPRIYKIIDYLKVAGISHVYSLDNDLAWKITLFSGEKIIARWADTSRQPAYYREINHALLNGERVALVGNILDEPLGFMEVAREEMPEIVADPYFVYINPSKKLIIQELRFQFDRPS